MSHRPVLTPDTAAAEHALDAHAPEADRQVRRFLGILALFMPVCFFFYFQNGITPINTTVYAFSWEYGFLSRGLLGTALSWLNKLVGGGLMRYSTVYALSALYVALFYGVLLLFFRASLRRCDSGSLFSAEALIAFFSIFAFPMFLTYQNFGRPDILMITASLVGCMLLLRGRGEFFIVPLSVACVLIHQGYVFMFYHVLLVLLIYRIMGTSGRKRRQLIAVLLSSFVLVSALFVYLEFFSHGGGAEIFDEIVTRAKAMGLNGKYHKGVIDHEILGIDLFEREWNSTASDTAAIGSHVYNLVETPIFLLCFLPYIVLLVRIFKGIFAESAGKEKFKYLIVALGAWTILPSLILKIDYGRWFFSIIFYYCAVLLCLMAMRDALVTKHVNATLSRLRGQATGVALLIYPLAFVPLQAVKISEFTRNIVGFFVLIVRLIAKFLR